jgi:DNA-directed RNA polymerase subunit E'/Rpb7
MDPLFERRELVRNIHLESRFLQRNIQASLLAQLRMKYEGICSSEGYIQRQSITIVDHSLGRTNLIKGGLDYNVRFQADVCMPHPGQRFKAPVTLRSKIGIHAETPPIKVLIPRDLHLGNEEFEAIKVDDDIEFEVVGSQFKQEDETIVVVGRLLSKIAAPVELPLNVASVAEEVKEESKSESVGEEEGEKKVVITADDKPKKRRLKRTEGGSNNNELPITF